MRILEAYRPTERQRAPLCGDHKERVVLHSNT